MPHIVFTIVSRNYAAHAAVLMRSVASADPEVERIVVATDGEFVHPALQGVEILDARKLVPDFGSMSLYYDALELNTAVKPLAFQHLLARGGVDTVTYLDPDIRIFAPLSGVRQALRRSLVALTPHLSGPLGPAQEPSDLTILRSGAFNLGFMAARPDAEVERFVEWWGARCRFDCRVDFAAGLFTDQRWVDLAPGFVRELAILHDPALNVAYWNLLARTLTRVENEWRVDDRPLGFFHFSGFDPFRPQLLSRHQNSIPPANNGPLHDLLALYAKELREQGYGKAHNVEYGHARFEGGRTVTALMRRTALAGARTGVQFRRPDDAAECWLDAADPASIREGVSPLTRVSLQAWRDIPGADEFFPIDTPLARKAWLARLAKVPGVDRRSLEAQDQIWQSWREAQRTAASTHYLVEEQPCMGPAAKVFEWFRDPDQIGLPRACKAMLQARADLRAAFPNDLDGDGLLAWCIGPEAVASRFDASLLPDSVLDRIARTPRLLMNAVEFANPSNRAAISRASGDLGWLVRAAYSLSEAAGWPARLREPLFHQVRSAAEAALGGLRLPRRSSAVWATRPDLQRIYDVARPLQRLRFLYWMYRVGREEYGFVPRSRSQGRVGGQIASLVVTTDQEAARVILATKGAGTVALFNPQTCCFAQPDGREIRPPAWVGEVMVQTPPPFLPADLMALYRRGVRWGRSVEIRAA